MIRRYVVLLLQAVFLVTTARAQQYPFQHFDARQGVPSVRTMAYDPAGLLWLGTSSGLVHYDGHRFTTIDLETPRQPVIEHLDVWDETGWVLTRSHRLYRVDRLGFVQRVPLPEPVKTAVQTQASTAVHLRTTGRTLLLAVGTTLWRLDEAGHWSRLLDGLDVEIRDLYAAPDGTIYLATPERIGRVATTHLSQIQWLVTMPEGHVVFVRPRADGRLWVGTERGLYLWSLDTLEEILGPRYRCWPFADPGLRADGGLAVEIETTQPDAAKNTRVFAPDGQLQREISTRNGLPSPIISSLTYDREGGLWVGSATGVSYLEDHHAVTFPVRTPGSEEEEAFLMLAEHPGNGALWISTYGGVFRLHEDRLYYVDTGVRRRMASPLTISRTGEVFWQEYPFEAQFYRWDDGQIYHEPGRGVLVAERPDGTRLFLRQHRLYREHKGRRVALHGQVRNRVDLPAAFAPDGRVWFYNGIGLDTVVGDSLASAMQGPRPASLQAVLDRHRRGPRIFDMDTGPDGTVWFSVEDIGLVRLWKDPDGRWRSTTYGTQSGLLSTLIPSIQALPDGRIWLGTLRGVQGLRLTPAGTLDPFKELRAADGLPSEYIKDVIEDRSGVLWIGTDKPALVRYDLRAASPLASPAAWIRDLEVNGHPHRTAPQLRLRADTTRLTLTLASNTFRQNHRVRYQYRLLGLDSTWTAPSAQRSVQFAHLPPGRYTFQARAVREDRPPGPVTAQPLVLTPPFYQAAWFYALCAVLGGALVLGAYIWRVRRYRQRQHHLEAVVSERTAQLRDQADRLARLDQAKNRFFANISHEFRTPLTLIIGPLEEGLDDDPDVRRRQETLMLRNARRLLHLVEQLLDLARLESGQLKLDPQSGDLAAFIRTLVQRFQPLAERAHIALRFNTTLQVLSFTFDPDAVEKIVGNLVSNALKFTPEGGKVWVTLGTEMSDWAEIVVKDTGPGIPNEALDRLFERFHHVENKAVRANQGAGLGLALAHELTALLGGQLLVESEPGFGSAFTVRLPELQRDETPSTLPSADATPRAPSRIRPDAPETRAPGDGTSDSAPQAPTILVVDDHREVRALIRSHLESHYHVVEANNGEDALQTARTHAPALILSDVMMPELDGVSFVQALRADEQLRSIPVILLTARAAEEDVVEGLEAGADDYLTKPFSADELRARIARLLETRHTLRQQFSDEVLVRPAGVAVPSEEEAFIEQVLDVTEARMGNAHFGVGALADALSMSTRQLRRRLKEAVGETPGVLIRRLRLERAAQLLEAEAGTVAEITYRVGYRTPSHFSKAFRDHFGHSPSEHIEKRS